MALQNSLASALARAQKLHARCTANALALFQDTTQEELVRAAAAARLIGAINDIGVTGLDLDFPTGRIVIGAR